MSLNGVVFVTPVEPETSVIIFFPYRCEEFLTQDLISRLLQFDIASWTGVKQAGRLLNTLNKNYMEFSFVSSYQLSLSDPDILFAYHIQAFVALWQNL